MNLVKTSFIALCVLATSVVSAEMPHIQNVTINPTPPGAKVGVAFLNIHNPTDEELTLTKVSSSVIGRVEIHRTEIVDDVAKMRKMDNVSVESQESVAFTHGGYHIMLMDLTEPLMPGELIPLTFHTSHGDVTLDVRVADSIQLPKDSHDSLSHGSHSNHGMDAGDAMDCMEPKCKKDQDHGHSGTDSSHSH